MGKKYGTAAEIQASLSEYFPRNEYAVMFEVSNDAGFGRSRSADAVAMGLWPSRGLRIHGIEIKVSRSDLLKELATPAKAEAVAQYCDHWWIACPVEMLRGDDLVPRIPQGWGILAWTPAVGDGTGKAAKPATLRVYRDAPFLTADVDRSALPRGFVACLLRRASEADAGMVQAMVDKQLEPRIKAIEDRHERRVAEYRDHNAQALKTLEEFRTRTGLDMGRWGPDEGLIAAINAVHTSRLFERYGGIEILAEKMRQTLAALETLAEYGKARAPATTEKAA